MIYKKINSSNIRKITIISIALLAMVVTPAFAYQPDAGAQSATTSEYDAKRTAEGKCDGNSDISGAIWADPITVPQGTQTATLSIRGAAYRCDRNINSGFVDPYYNLLAVEIYAQNSSVLYNFASDRLERGNGSNNQAGAKRTWTSPESHKRITATINLRNLGLDTNSAGLSCGVTSIYRTLGMNVKRTNGSVIYVGDAPGGGGWEQPVKVCVNFTQNWSLASNVSANRTSAAPGDTITWTHTVRNSGPSSTPIRVLSHFENTLPGGGFWDDGVSDGAAVHIKPRSNSGLCIDIPGMNTADRTLLRLYNCNWSSAQMWKFIDEPFNRIRNPASNKCIDVPGSSTTPGTQVQLYRCNDSNAQGWVYQSSTGMFRNANTPQRCLAITNPPATYNAEVRIHTCNSTAVQQKWDVNSRSGMWGGDREGVIGAGSTRTFTSTHVVRASDVGDTICRMTAATPENQNSNGWSQSGNACVTITPRYTLTPSVDLITSVVEPGGEYRFRGAISNAGPSSSVASKWKMTEFYFGPGVSINPTVSATTRNYTDDICAVYSETDCDRNARGVTTTGSINPLGYREFDGTFSAGSTNVPASYVSKTVGDTYQAGGKICFVLSVKDRNQTVGSGWINSVMECLDLGKRPKMQIVGGDLSVGRNFTGISMSGSPALVNTSVSSYGNAPDGRFGSWVEYAVFAPGTISGFGSARVYDGGIRSGSSPQVTKLSFANTSLSSTACSTSSGCFSNNMGVIPDVAGKLYSGGVPATLPLAPTSLNVNTYTAGVYDWRGNIRVTGQGGSIPVGKSLVIRTTGTVTIDGDISYSTSAANLPGRLPQLLIFANKIVIRENVQRVDAWLIAGSNSRGASAPYGVIETCSMSNAGSSSFNLTGTSRLTTDKCNQPLTVNGPVMARELWLRRTAGGDVTSRAEPAERFNMRADAFLWAYAQGIQYPTVRTTEVTEVAPRF